MSGFHKAVCLAAMVALVVPSLQTRADDPPLRLAPLPGNRPVLPAINVGADNPMVIVGGDVFFLGQGTVPYRNSSSAEDLFPVVSQGFASDHRVDGPLTPLLKPLHADSYRDRAAATEQLMRLPPDRLPDVVTALSHEKDPEAISRLKAIAGHLFLKPRTNVKGAGGFLGIGASGDFISMVGMKFDNPEKMTLPGGDEPGVVVRVTDLQPGFPAAQDLRTGDCIVAIGGKSFPEEMATLDIKIATSELTDSFIIESAMRERQDISKRMFQDRIRALAPGSVATFRVLRDGKLLDVSIQLAAMPANSRDSMSALVELRNQMMHDFVESLKTGEDSQAQSPTSQEPAAARL